MLYKDIAKIQGLAKSILAAIGFVYCTIPTYMFAPYDALLSKQNNILQMHTIYYHRSLMVESELHDFLFAKKFH